MTEAQTEAEAPTHDSGRLSDADRQVIVARFQAGATCEQLAEGYGVSLSTVKRLLRKAGVRRKDWPKRSA